VAYYTECNWCGADLKGRDHASLPVKVKRQRRGRLDAHWAEEVRPTLHFCVADDGADYDRLGLDRPDGDADCCFTRALAAINGTSLEAPDMGLEWRLVPVGATVNEASDGEAEPVDEGVLAEPLWELDTHWSRRGKQIRTFSPSLIARGLDLTACPTPFNVYWLREDGSYETVGDLRRAIEDESLLEVKRLGQKTFRWIKETVERFLASESRENRPRRVAGREA